MRYSVNFLAVVLLAGLAVPAVAGSKPNPSTPANPQEMYKLHTGKTTIWSKGGAYWGKKGSFQAVWSGAIADGKWYVTADGTVCYDADWTSKKDGKVSTENGVVNCWKHVVDDKGRLWRRSHKEEDWYKVNFDKEVKGNKIKKQYKLIANQFGS